MIPPHQRSSAGPPGLSRCTVCSESARRQAALRGASHAQAQRYAKLPDDWIKGSELCAYKGTWSNEGMTLVARTSSIFKMSSVRALLRFERCHKTVSSCLTNSAHLRLHKTVYQTMWGDAAARNEASWLYCCGIVFSDCCSARSKTCPMIERESYASAWLLAGMYGQKRNGNECSLAMSVCEQDFKSSGLRTDS